MVLTEGTKFFYDNGAGWLFGLISSYQNDNRITSNEDLHDFQL